MRRCPQPVSRITGRLGASALMRYAAGHLSQRAQPFVLHDRLLGLAQLFVRPLLPLDLARVRM